MDNAASILVTRGVYCGSTDGHWKNGWPEATNRTAGRVDRIDERCSCSTGPKQQKLSNRKDRHDHLRNGSKLTEIVTLSTIDAIASILGRYGLVVVIGWIGALKFANYEAHQIAPLVAHSPFMSWLYHIFPVYTFSAVLG